MTTAAEPARTPEQAEKPGAAAVEGSPPAAQGAPEPSARLASLDAFRGLTILSMLLVNNVALDAATPRQLTHAPWNGGVHYADLVFPWFLFIVGVAIPWGAASLRRKGTPFGVALARIARRTLSLFLLGLLIDSSLARRPVFGLGVLQLIALAYAVGALLYPLRLPWRMALAGALLVGHWAAIRFVPVPGVGTGVFTAEQNLIAYLNQAHLQAYGLKGLLSVVPTTALVLIGTACGDLLRSERLRPARRAALLGAAGAALVAAGLLWGLDLPPNKPVWTASYILLGAGTGGGVLALLFFLQDVAGCRAWAFPLVVAGSNAILAYVAPILVKIHVLQEWTWPAAGGATVPLQQAILRACVAAFGPVPGGWTYTALYLLFWWLVLLALHRRRLYLRV
jgi:predicted acyltransferase